MSTHNAEVRVVEIPEKYTITVVLPGGSRPRAVTVEGRVAKLIVWLISHRARVERLGQGALVFNCGLTSFQPVINETFPRQHAQPEDFSEAAGGLVGVPDPNL